MWLKNPLVLSSNRSVYYNWPERSNIVLYGRRLNDVLGRQGNYVCFRIIETTTYRTSSRTNGTFKIFLSFDQVINHMSLNNPAFRLISEHFSCPSNSWWNGDISTKEVIDLESVFSFHGLHQLITDSTHILC